MKQVNKHTDIDGVVTYSITEYHKDGYSGRLTDNETIDGRSYTDWCEYVGYESACKAYIHNKENLSKEMVLEWFKTYTCLGCCNDVLLKLTKDVDKYNIPNTIYWLYKCGQHIELIAREPKMLRGGTPSSYAVWNTKDEPVLASVYWSGDIFMVGEGKIGELE